MRKRQADDSLLLVLSKGLGHAWAGHTIRDGGIRIRDHGVKVRMWCCIRCETSCIISSAHLLTNPNTCSNIITQHWHRQGQTWERSDRARGGCGKKTTTPFAPTPRPSTPVLPSKIPKTETLKHVGLQLYYHHYDHDLT